MSAATATAFGGLFFAILPLILLIAFIGWFISKLNSIEHRLESIDCSLKQIAEKTSEHIDES